MIEIKEKIKRESKEATRWGRFFTQLATDENNSSTLMSYHRAWRKSDGFGALGAGYNLEGNLSVFNQLAN